MLVGRIEQKNILTDALSSKRSELGLTKAKYLGIGE